MNDLPTVSMVKSVVSDGIILQVKHMNFIMWEALYVGGVWMVVYIRSGGF